MSSQVISIEGNIGSGKSTFIKILKKKHPEFIYLLEPIDIWNTIVGENGDNILTLFYKDQEKYAFAFQMMAYISRLSSLKKIINENPGKIIITERSLYTDKNVFAKMLYDDNKINKVEYDIYCKWFDEFSVPITKYIYMKSDPYIAMQRIINRNRSGETLSIEYLSQCDIYHDRWLLNCDNKLILNVNQNIYPVEKTDCVDNWVSNCVNYIIN